MLSKRGMPKNKKSAVYDHYEATPEGKGKCRHCGQEFACPLAGNLKKHLRLDHFEVFCDVEKADATVKIQRSRSQRPGSTVTYASIRSEIRPPKFKMLSPTKPAPEVEVKSGPIDYVEYFRNIFGQGHERESDELEAPSSSSSVPINDGLDPTENGFDINECLRALSESGFHQSGSANETESNRDGNSSDESVVFVHEVPSRQKKDHLKARVIELESLVHRQDAQIADLHQRVAYLENSLRQLVDGLNVAPQ